MVTSTSLATKFTPPSQKALPKISKPRWSIISLTFYFVLSQRYCKFNMSKKNQPCLSPNKQLIFYKFGIITKSKRTPQKLIPPPSHLFGHPNTLQVFPLCLVQATMTFCLDLCNVIGLPASTPDHSKCSQNCFCLIMKI